MSTEDEKGKLSEDELDRIYREGYLRIPETTEIAEVQEALLVELFANDEPWDEFLTPSPP